jgi:hypothetical protein
MQCLVMVVAIYMVTVGLDDNTKPKHIGSKGWRPSGVKWLEYVKSLLKPATANSHLFSIMQSLNAWSQVCNLLWASAL